MDGVVYVADSDDGPMRAAPPGATIRNRDGALTDRRRPGG